MEHRRSFYLSYRVKVLREALSCLLLILLVAALVRGMFRGESVGLLWAALAVLVLGELAARRWIFSPFQARERALRLIVEGGVNEQEGAVLTCALSPAEEQMFQQMRKVMDPAHLFSLNKRQAQYLALQNQINPHFLYNTMDTIIWLIEAEKTEEAVEMVSNLSAFFRHSLSRGQDVITLREEEHVCSYLQIQQVRYKDIMRYTVNIAPELKDVLIPKLTLQPLVENALYHGIKQKRGLGHIYVMGRGEGEDILLQVTDDGVGMSPERLEELRSALERGERVGFGLSTVHERMRLFFGAPYGLSISSQPGVGTTVSVRIPRRKEEPA